MTPQSTRHLMLIEPAVFYANPETMETNVYQVDEREDPDIVFQRALGEWRGFRDMLVENGVIVSSVKGHKDCPDHLFPNWMSLHGEKGMILYPMLSENRRKEKTPGIIEFAERYYDLIEDLSHHEDTGEYLESTGSLWRDRANKIVYAALSPRTDEGMVRTWAEKMGYTPVIFRTNSHVGTPIYHTDLVMFIGTDVAGVCAECIVEEDRDTVINSIRRTHEVVELTMDQQKAFCGNSLEVLGAGNERMLVMSSAAYNALRDDQVKAYEKHFAKLLHAPIPTIELYGGGSARCLIMEMF